MLSERLAPEFFIADEIRFVRECIKNVHIYMIVGQELIIYSFVYQMKSRQLFSSIRLKSSRFQK